MLVSVFKMRMNQMNNLIVINKQCKAGEDKLPKNAL